MRSLTNWRYWSARACRWVAFKLPPAIAYHAAIRVAAHSRDPRTPYIPMMQAIRDYEDAFPKYLR